MTARRTASSSLSADIIHFLIRRGNTQAQIARMLHVSEGFVSLVKAKERCLSLDHLELLAAALSMPLGEMLLQVAPTKKSGSKSERRFMEVSEKIIRMGDEIRSQILKQPKRSTRKSA